MDTESTTPTEFAAAAGEVLRRVREGRSLSLRQVTVRSGGRFKPSSVASYERGDRQISLERFFALAGVYDIAPERITAAIAYRLGTGRVYEQAPDPLLVVDPLILGSGER
jgi:transcriptional regulator with XRE-family HTH domain